MTRTLIALFSGALLVVGTIVPACAAPLPPGSYQQSCTDIRIRGDRLTARCTPPNGSARRSSIDIDSCREGDIANVNGNLTCNFQRRHDRDRDDRPRLPPGSYQQSCSHAYIDADGRLAATCNDVDGNAIRTTLDFHRCDRTADIGNRNGHLFCRR
jgi:hypothetical protein